MIPAIDLARAEQRQRIVAIERQSHRDCLKTIEVEDQALKRLIRTGRAYLEAIDSAPPTVLALVGILLECAADPVLVEIPEPPVTFMPAKDHVPEAPPAPPSPTKAAARKSIAQAGTQARPNAAKVSALADEIYTLFGEARHGSTSSLEVEFLLRTAGKSPVAIERALSDLVERKLIRRVKAAERGHRTVLLTGGAA